MHVHETLKLLANRVAGLRENVHQLLLTQSLQGHAHREATHKLGDQSVRDDITGLYLLHRLGGGFDRFFAVRLIASGHRFTEPNGALGLPLLNDVLKTSESTP